MIADLGDLVSLRLAACILQIDERTVEKEQHMTALSRTHFRAELLEQVAHVIERQIGIRAAAQDFGQEFVGLAHARKIAKEEMSATEKYAKGIFPVCKDHPKLRAFRSQVSGFLPTLIPFVSFVNSVRGPAESSPTVTLSAAEALRSAVDGPRTISPIPSTSAPPGRACETAATSVTQNASPGVHRLHQDPKTPVGSFVNSVRGHPEQPFSPTIHLPRFRTRLPWAEARISALPASHHRQFSNFSSVIFNLQSLHPITRQP